MQGEITFHLNSGRKESWIIIEADFDRLMLQMVAPSTQILRFITVNDGREVFVRKERIEVVEFSLINANTVCLDPAAGPDEVVTETDWARMSLVPITELLTLNKRPDDKDEDDGGGLPLSWDQVLGLDEDWN